MSDIVEVDVTTGEKTVRNYTTEEIEYREYLEAQLAAKIAELQENN
jgi:hypothetical protein